MRALKLFRAMYAFYQSLWSQECEHSQVNFAQVHLGKKGGASHCPSCGYKIQLLWVLIKCRDCDTKRVPRRMPDGSIKPFQRFCNQCGSAEYKLIKRQQIDAYDLHYSLSVKEIDYADDRIQWGQDGFSQSRQKSGYGQNPFDIVEGEVLRKQYFHQKQDATKGNPPEWSPSKASATTNKFQLPKVLNPPLWEKTRI